MHSQATFVGVTFSDLPRDASEDEKEAVVHVEAVLLGRNITKPRCFLGDDITHSWVCPGERDAQPLHSTHMGMCYVGTIHNNNNNNNNKMINIILTTIEWIQLHWQVQYTTWSTIYEHDTKNCGICTAIEAH